ncbi:MAG: cellulase family glycosylhydrolase [Anaerolineaceae bacterium]|nr:cellulase family glycosylhydrolase [Anaerolineaceae bacterium]
MHIDGSWFKDEYGRTLLLRGVCLGGSSKVPARPDGATHHLEGFFDHRNVSFVGRPFPLEEADEHFRRLKHWGFTFLRFLVTWEAIEHAGPGIYDQDYLEYVTEVAARAGQYGIRLFIDPHQDAWSRFTGGDGAPGWTLEAAGMQLENLVESGAAVVHNQAPLPFPRMLWPSNNMRLGAATMYTLFFGGNDFAPRTRVDGEPVQEYLQRHYIQSIRELAVRLSHLDNVAGYDTLNEPYPGYLGWRDLTRPDAQVWKGVLPSPLQAMALGEGATFDLPVWDHGLLGRRSTGRRTVNPRGVRLWREDRACVWRDNGVWEMGADGRPHLLRPAHFTHFQGRRVDFDADYLKPFAMRFAGQIQRADPRAMIFFEGTPSHHVPAFRPGEIPNLVNTSHWYDGLTLFTKHFHGPFNADYRTLRPVFGSRSVRHMFASQLADMRRWSEEKMGGAPTLIGEFGIPFDLDGKRAFHNGNFKVQAAALDASFRALEANLLGCTLWNYTADNDNRWGDQWNEEDLSIFSRDQQTDSNDVHSGGRALSAAVRPYAVCTAGEPLHMAFERSGRLFRFTFRHDPGVTAPTEIYVPDFHYGAGVQVHVSDGDWQYRPETQTLVYRHTLQQPVHEIILRPGRG